jgi:hypothetical protein
MRFGALIAMQVDRKIDEVFFMSSRDLNGI